MLRPILPIDRVVPYQKALGLPLPICMEKIMLTLRIAFMVCMETGWEKLVAATAGVYNRLAPIERSRTGILAFNYAPAGAIDLLGPKYGKAISNHMAYHTWGRGITTDRH